jgi:hypothetical protein
VQVGRELVGELSRCDADDAPARDGQGSGLRPVGLEGAARSVGGVAVELDDETLVWPDEVAFVEAAAGSDVEVRARAR